MIFSQNSISERRSFALQSLQSLWADYKNINPEPVGEGDGEEDDDGQNYNFDEDEESIEGVELVDTGALLDKDDYSEYQLSKHHRCACHLLILVSTADASKAEVNPLYNCVARSTFAKCSSLWNKSSTKINHCT